MCLVKRLRLEHKTGKGGTDIFLVVDKFQETLVEVVVNRQEKECLGCPKVD